MPLKEQILKNLAKGPLREHILRGRLMVEDDEEWDDALRELVFSGQVSIQGKPGGIELALMTH